MKKDIVLLTLFFSTIVCSQNKTNSTNDFQNIVGSTATTGMWVPSAVADATIEGTVYLFPSWEQVHHIHLKNNQDLKLYNLNYNIQTRILESQVAKDSVFQFNIESFDKIKRGNYTYKVINKVLYQEIFDGQKIKCFKGFSISTTPGVFNPLTQSMTKLAKYVIKEKYYYQLKDDFIEFKPSKKNILKIVADKKEIVSAEIKDKKYDVDNDNDLNLLLQFYDSL
jgi:hypothetical protein